MLRYFLFILLKILICSNLLFGNNKGDIWTTFTTKDGLIDNRVRSIFESSDGTLWFGTDNGVSHFQNGDWKSIDGLTHKVVMTISDGIEGSLWFGTWGTGVCCIRKDGSLETFNTTNGFISDYIHFITNTRNETIWFVTNKGIILYSGSTWLNFETEFYCTGLLEESDGSLWFWTENDGVYKYNPNDWTHYTNSQGLANNNINILFESSDGKLWCGHDDGKISFFIEEEDRWQEEVTYADWPDNDIFEISESADGTLWFATWGRGIYYYRKDKWDNFNTSHGLIDNYVYTLNTGSDGAVWFGTRKGLCRFQDGIWITFATEDGLVSNDIWALEESIDNSLWFGTFGGGISRYKNNIWSNYTTVTTQGKLSNDYIMAITETNDSTIWFGTWGGGISCLMTNGAWKNYTKANTNNKLVYDYICTITEASDEVVWIGTISGGISNCYKEIWENIPTQHLLGENAVWAICESSDGLIWFGTWGAGVLCLEDDSLTNVSTKVGLTETSIVPTIIKSKDGALWFGTWYEGVIRYQNGTWNKYTMIDGLADNSIKTILEASDDAIWFGTVGGGVSRYKNDHWISFNTFDGLADNDVRDIMESWDGALWFATRGGGVNRVKPDYQHPFTYIGDDIRDETVIGISNPLFSFHGFDYRTQKEELVYSWIAIDLIENTQVDGDSTAFFSQTTAQPFLENNGKYQFKVWARDRWLNVDPTPATTTFTVDITQPTVLINYPKTQDIVSGDVEIIGSAFDSSPLKDFEKYDLSYGFGPDREKISKWDIDNRITIPDSTKEIRDSTLAIWNTEGLINGPYWLQLSAWDTLEHESHDYVQVQVVKTSAMLDARQGGNLGTEFGKIEIYIPPNAISKDEKISVKGFPIQDIVPIDNQQITFVNLCFEIIPADLHLLKPGTMSLIYPDSTINGKNEEKLAIYFSPNGKEDWQRLGGTANVEENKITTTFKQLGVFALYEDLTEGGKAGILNVNSQPRIFSPQGGGYDTQTAISFELGKESNVTIKIYNPAGRLVKLLKENEQMSHGNNVVYWDGKDQQGEFCVSGLYIVTIQAEEKIAAKTVVVLNKY